uniref:Uncharacterized protein n=1 Tax=Meloidogyne incognita TaxID=6306 RepID=A0A914N967_MELIC
MPAYNDEIFNTNIEQNVLPKLAVFEADTPPVAPQIKKSRKMDSQKFRSELIKNIDTFIFDADGVLWLGENAIPGSSSFIEHVAELGKRIIVLTNNATKSRAVYAKKLAGLGYGRYINE